MRLFGSEEGSQLLKAFEERGGLLTRHLKGGRVIRRSLNNRHPRLVELVSGRDRSRHTCLLGFLPLPVS